MKNEKPNGLGLVTEQGDLGLGFMTLTESEAKQVNEHQRKQDKEKEQD